VTGELTGVAIDWWTDWYDGPIAGVASYGGHRYWFRGAGPDDYEPALDSSERRLYLYPMTDEEQSEWAALYAWERVFRVANEEQRQRLFEQEGHADREPESSRTPYTARESIGWCMYR
jgi:hypothetical protein